MSEEKKDDVPDHVWNDECLWDWERYLVGLKDEEVERIIARIKAEVVEAYLQGRRDKDEVQG